MKRLINLVVFQRKSKKIVGKESDIRLEPYNLAQTAFGESFVWKVKAKYSEIVFFHDKITTATAKHVFHQIKSPAATTAKQHLNTLFGETKIIKLKAKYFGDNEFSGKRSLAHYYAVLLCLFTFLHRTVEQIVEPTNWHSIILSESRENSVS